MRNAPAREALGLRFDRLSIAGYAALALALVAFWMLGRRYGGIRHDASIYIVQGLRRLDPEAFGKDLFFAHGSQDSYTVVSYFYAPLIDALGAGAAAMAVTIAGQIAFFAAAAALVMRIAAGPARWWSLALLAMVSGTYGGSDVFRLAEQFATARSLAEPLVLAAFACLLASRHLAAIVALVVAAALHPLVAAPGIAAVFLWHACERRRLLWLIPLLAAALPVLAVPWPGITQRFDAPWLAAVLERSPHLFIAQWQLTDWSRFLWGLCVTWIAARHVEAPVRRLLHVVVAIALAGVAASWVAVDLLGSAFAAGLQLWRAHWPMHFLAIALVPVAVAGLWRAGNGALALRMSAACIGASCSFGRAELPVSALFALLAIIFAATQKRWPGWMSERAFRTGLLATLFAAAVGLMFEMQVRLPLVYGATQAPAWTDYVHVAASVGGLLPLAILVWILAYSRYAILAPVLAVSVLAVGIAAWDARAPWPRFLEQASAAGNPFREILPRDAQVFWPGPYGRVWIALGRPAWFSVDQGAGVVFNRQTAIAYAERKLATAELRSAIENCAMLESQACRIDVRPVRALCERQDGPDYLVLNGRIEGHAAREWQMPADIGPGRQSLFLYACPAFAANEKGRR
jgi:hypothetical protein